MQVEIISAFSYNDLENQINDIIKLFNCTTNIERSFTYIKDIKLTYADGIHTAMIIYDDIRTIR